MVLEFDTKMLLYLGIITIGIFLLPIEHDPPVYLIAGIVIAVIGTILVIIKVKKK
jgi:hypothetical protein